MFKKRLKNPIFLFYILLSYVIIQFSWWVYLIHSLYAQTYPADILEKKVWMLIGEGTVFALIVSSGAIIINRAFKKEKRLNQQQENFLLSISHELKTPIASVKLLLQTLQKHELSTEKKEEIHALAMSDVDRLESLVANLLMARNIENQNYYLNKVDVKLDQFIEDKIAGLKKSILRNRNINLHLEAVNLNVDETAFYSILLNLIENAVKYSPSDSEITVTLLKKDGIYLSIADQGKGIPTQLKETVFKKFFRPENEMTRKSKGSGLGLYIVKFMVEAHNGSIILKDNQPNGLIAEMKFNG